MTPRTDESIRMAELKSARDDNIALCAENAVLRNQIATLLKQNTTVTDEKDRVIASLRHTENKVVMLTRVLESKCQEITVLSEFKERAIKMSAEDHKDISTLQKRINQLNTDAVDANRLKESLMQSLEARCKEITTLTNCTELQANKMCPEAGRIKVLEAALLKSQGLEKEYFRQNKELGEDLKEANTEISCSQTYLNEVKATHTAIVEEKNAITSKLQNELGAKTEQIETLKKENSELVAKNVDLEKTVKAQSERIDYMHRNSEAHARTVVDMRKEINEARKQNGELVSKNVELKNELDYEKEHEANNFNLINEMRKQNGELVSKNAELEKIQNYEQQLKVENFDIITDMRKQNAEKIATNAVGGGLTRSGCIAICRESAPNQTGAIPVSYDTLKKISVFIREAHDTLSVDGGVPAGDIATAKLLVHMAVDHLEDLDDPKHLIKFNK